ncbi:MAG: transcriptional regulator NrdR [Planctomycetota bacterium]
MQCPFCGQDSDKVVDSRSSEGGRVVRRRRQCLACKRRFTTYERIEDTIRITVVKKDDSRVPYDRNKILAGLQAACYKRPVSEADLRQIVDATEEEIFRRYDKEVPSSFIGDAVSRRLRAVDQVAYVRFASVYRAFEDVGEFLEEVAEVMNTPDDAPEQGRLFDRPPPAARKS